MRTGRLASGASCLTHTGNGTGGGFHFYRVHNTKILTVSLTVSAHAGSTDIAHSAVLSSPMI